MNIDGEKSSLRSCQPQVSAGISFRPRNSTSSLLPRGSTFKVIPNHPDLPARLQNLEPGAPNQTLRVLRRTKRANRRDWETKALAALLPPLPPPVLQPHEDFYSDYPEDWIDVTAEASEDYLLPTHAVNVPSRTVYSVAGERAATLQSTPSCLRDSIMALRDIDTELHEHAHTVHGINDLI